METINNGLTNLSSAADNNKGHILERLTDLLIDPATVLEIGSGSGQHAMFFSQALPHITWQPADQGEYFEGLKSNILLAARENLRNPVYLDLNNPDWPVNSTDHIYTANVLHIMPESLISPLFSGAARIMSASSHPNNLLCIYGPFKYQGKFTTESNERFDGWLKNRNPLSGIRDIEQLQALGEENGFILQNDFNMPANNQFLVFGYDSPSNSQTAQPTDVTSP